MKKRETNPLKNGKPGDAARNKMDDSMKRLLETNDEEILSRFNTDFARLDKKRAAVEKKYRLLSLKANKAKKQALMRERNIHLSELMPHRDLVAVVPGKIKPVRIKALTCFTGNRSDLESMGIKVHSQAQDIFTISGTRQQLIDLANRPSCRRLRTPKMLFPLVEEACNQAEINAVHAPSAANPNGYRGNGVLIGIIDSALDVTHHGFLDPGGAHGTRVLYYWVQDPDAAGAPGQNPEQFFNANPGTSPNFTGLNYGILYTQNYIDTAIGLANPYGNGNNQISKVPAADEHGTHCAGIAAGSGHLTNWNSAPVHVGAAPEATLVFVSLASFGSGLVRDATSENRMLEAMAFCMEVQRFHNMPMALSVSQGNNLGPHNGKSDYDQGRDNLLNSFDNRSVIWAAGNDNDENGYRTGTITAGSTDNLTLTANRNVFFFLDVWYVGPELEYRITFNGVNSGWQPAGQNYQGILSGQDVSAERDPDPSGGMRGLRVYFDDARINNGYLLELRNPHVTDDVLYHAWTGSQGWWGSINGASQNVSTLADSACAGSIMTVGACSKLHPQNPASGEPVTAYSGAGPTLDGRIKPEIVAVGGTGGDQIISTASDQANGYIGMAGTSMATPLVAGAVALLFEEYGSAPPVGLGRELNQDTIKALLIRHTNRLNLHLDPNQAGYVAEERNRYGYGRLRMIGPIDQVRPPVDVDLWIRTAGDDYGDEPYPGGCFCCSPDIRVFNAGTTDETTNITWGTTYDVRVRVHNLGDTNAVNASIRLKYALPHTAPDTWFEAEDAGNQKLLSTVTVNAMDDEEALFHWRPEAAELNAPAGTTHFCLLAEVDHPDDPLIYPAPSSGGGNAWSTNIKGTNNVALRNLHIQ